MLLALPSSVQNERARRDLLALRRRIRKRDDQDVTGFDASSPALWLITRGVTYILVLNGNWQQRQFYRHRGWISSHYVGNEDDGSYAMQHWLNEVWPTITGEPCGCTLEKTRAGERNDRLRAKIITQPILKSASGSPSWGMWNKKRGSSLRMAELRDDSPP